MDVETGPPEQVFQKEGALRDAGRVLEQADVAGHQRGRGEPDHLPERKVPGHDSQHGAERQGADEGPCAVYGVGLVRQQTLGVLGIEVAGAGALLGLLDRGPQGLANL